MSDDLRRRVLDASVTLVLEGGIGALSMREVARRAGVSHQAPYHHFGDRSGILAALAQEGFARLADDVAGATGADPAARLGAAGQAYVRFALAWPAHYQVMFRRELVELSSSPDAQAEAKRALDGLVAASVACRDAGLYDDVDVLVAGAWSLVHGLAMLLLDGSLPTRGGARAEVLVARVPTLLADLLR